MRLWTPLTSLVVTSWLLTCTDLPWCGWSTVGTNFSEGGTNFRGVQIKHDSPYPILFSYCKLIAYWYTMWKPNKIWAPQIKTSLRWEWSRPLCSRPQVRSWKGLKPVVMRWPKRVLPWRPALLSIFYSNLLCHNCLTHSINPPFSCP